MDSSRILVVEDDPRLAATLDRVLAAETYDVEVACSLSPPCWSASASCGAGSARAAWRSRSRSSACSARPSCSCCPSVSTVAPCRFWSTSRCPSPSSSCCARARPKRFHRAVLYVGTSGWQYAHWRRVFYPEKLPQRLWLPYFAERFQTVEVNNTFYNLPEKPVFE